MSNKGRAKGSISFSTLTQHRFHGGSEVVDDKGRFAKEEIPEEDQKLDSHGLFSRQIRS
jgi:hypothetical protein